MPKTLNRPAEARRPQTIAEAADAIEAATLREYRRLVEATADGRPIDDPAALRTLRDADRTADAEKVAASALGEQVWPDCCPTLRQVADQD